MSIPARLQKERTQLQKEGRGSWRWWLGRAFGTLGVVTILWVDHQAHWSWLGVLGISAGAMLLWWLLALLVHHEQLRIQKKSTAGFSGGWIDAPVGGLFFGLILVMGSGGSGPISRLLDPVAPVVLLFLFAMGMIVTELSVAVRRTGFDLLDAREQVLQAKLAPHFIFNTLNTLHAQIDQDPRAAQATTERLAELFRRVVEAANHPTIPLKQELAFVEAYLGIERARLGERLRVTVDVPEALEAAQVPPLSLQVLVENAVKHGVAPLEQGGEVRIGAEQKERVLHLWVEDPGPGVSALQGTGTALATLRQRLEKPEDLDMGLVEGRHRVGFRWRQV